MSEGDYGSTSDGGVWETHDTKMNCSDIDAVIRVICRASSAVCWFCKKPGHYKDRCDSFLQCIQEEGYAGKELPASHKPLYDRILGVPQLLVRLKAALGGL